MYACILQCKRKVVKTGLIFLVLLVSFLPEKSFPSEASVSVSAACLLGLKSGLGPCMFLSTMVEILHNGAFSISNLNSTARTC